MQIVLAVLFCASNEENAVLARAFDEYRDSLGTCFQDVYKGSGAVGLRDCHSWMILHPIQGLYSNLKQGKSKEARAWHLRNSEI